MNASIWTAYGPPSVLKYGQLPLPRLSGPKDILIRVKSAGVFVGDCELRELRMPLMFKGFVALFLAYKRPKVLGQEFSGIVERVGEGVTRFKNGDAVFGTSGLNLGAYAEYIMAQEPAEGKPGEVYLAKKPASVSWEAASVSALAAMEALTYLRRVELRPGERVLVIGAGGNIGSFTIQMAKNYLQAGYTTAVDGPDQCAMLKELNLCDEVIDYTAEPDYLSRLAASNQRFDFILDVLGKVGFTKCIPVLNANGRFINSGVFGLYDLVELAWPKPDGKQMLLPVSPYQPDSPAILSEMLERGIIKPIIDKTFPLDKVAEAHEYVESGKKRGCVAISIGE